MKHYYIIALSAALTGACGTSSSVRQEQKPPLNTTDAELLETTLITGLVQEAIVSEEGDSTFSTIDFIYYEHPTTPYHDSINLYVQHFTQVHTQFDGAKPAVKLSVDFFKEQLKTFVKLYEEEEDGGDYGVVWSTETYFLMEQSYARFAELTMGNSAYTGGAHPNSETYTLHVDRTTGRRIPAKEFFTDMNALNAIVEKHFRRLVEIAPDQDLEEAGFWFENNRFSIGENFEVNSSDIEFYFNSYEVGPYSMGPIELMVPKSEIQHLFTSLLK